MQTTYLNEYTANDIAYLPIGTFEWHGNHLPLETDVIVAETLCKKLAEKIPGYVLPGIYLATDRLQNGFRGMETKLTKNLPGEIYFLEPELLIKTLTAVIKNLERDFKKIVIITGHAGSKQIETLERFEKENDSVVFINPFLTVNDIQVKHADENETSLLWACRPEEEAISRKMTISNDDDYFGYLGYDPREKASIGLGQKLFETMLSGSGKSIKKELGE